MSNRIDEDLRILTTENARIRALLQRQLDHPHRGYVLSRDDLEKINTQLIDLEILARKLNDQIQDAYGRHAYIRPPLTL